MNFQMFKLVLEEAEEPEIKLPTSVGSLKKQESFQKNIYFCFVAYAKAFDCVDHTNYGKFLKRWDYQTTLPAAWETCMQVKKQQLELGWEQQTGSKLEKEYNNAVYHHPAYLTSMQSTSKQTARLDESWARIKIAGTISTTSDMQMIPL